MSILNQYILKLGSEFKDRKRFKISRPLYGYFKHGGNSIVSDIYKIGT